MLQRFSKLCQLPYQFDPAPGTVRPRPPLDVKHFAEKRPELVLYVNEVCSEPPPRGSKHETGCEIVLDTRLPDEKNVEAHTVTIRFPFHHYAYVRVPLDLYWTQREVAAFKKHLLDTPDRKFYGKVELVRRQNLGGHRDFGQFLQISNHGCGTSMRMLKRFLSPCDISKCKADLMMAHVAEAMFQFEVFEANIASVERYMADTEISAFKWFTMRAGSYEVITSGPLTKRQLEIRLQVPHLEALTLIRGRIDRPGMRVLSFDGEMMARSLRFPVPTNPYDGTTNIGNVLTYTNDSEEPLEVVVFSLPKCRTDEAELKERAKPVGEAVPIYQCIGFPILTEAEFQQKWLLEQTDQVMSMESDEEVNQYDASSSTKLTVDTAWKWYECLMVARTRSEFEDFWRESGRTIGLPGTPAHQAFGEAWFDERWKGALAAIRTMLIGWSIFIDRFDPDIVITFNGDRFDWPWFFKEAVKLGLLETTATGLWGPTHSVPRVVRAFAKGQPCFGDFSMFHNEIAICRQSFTKSAGKGAREMYKIIMRGRHSYDLITDVRDTEKLPSYTLNEVSKHYLKKEKFDVSPRDMMMAALSFLDMPDDLKVMLLNEATAVYCGQDCRLPRWLLREFLMTDVKVTGAALTVGLNGRTIWQNGQMRRTHQAIVGEARNSNDQKDFVQFAVPTPLPQDDGASVEIEELEAKADDVQVPRLDANHEARAWDAALPNAGGEDHDEEGGEANEEEELFRDRADGDAQAEEEKKVDVDMAAAANTFDFHWDIDPEEDKRLGLRAERFEHHEDRVEKLIEMARVRAHLRIEAGEAKSGDVRPFKLARLPDEPLHQYLSRTQQLSSLSARATVLAKQETKEAKKAKTAAKHKRGYQGAVQLTPEKGLHVEDAWDETGMALCRDVLADEKNAGAPPQLKTWYATTLKLLEGKMSAEDRFEERCVALAKDAAQRECVPVPINTLDHKSMYPNIIIMFNMSYETLLRPANIKKYGYTERKWPRFVLDQVTGKFVRPPITGDYWTVPAGNGRTHCYLARPGETPNGIEGLLPRVLRKQLASRENKKASMKVYEQKASLLDWKIRLLTEERTALINPDMKIGQSRWQFIREDATRKNGKVQLQAMAEVEKEAGTNFAHLRNEDWCAQTLSQWAKASDAAWTMYNIFDKGQQQDKIAANSVYGFTGVPKKIAMLPCEEIAESVTAVGRMLLEEDRDMAELYYDGSDPELRPLCRVIYGDTDSIMVRFTFCLLRRLQHWRLQLAMKAVLHQIQTRGQYRGKTAWSTWIKVLAAYALGYPSLPDPKNVLNRLFANAPDDALLQTQVQQQVETQRLIQRCNRLRDEDFMDKNVFLGYDSVSRMNPAHILPTELAFETVYYPFLIPGYKRYATMKFAAGKTLDEGVMSIKGMQAIRTEYCLFVRRMLKKFMDAIFVHRNVPAAEAIARDGAQKLLAYKVSQDELALSKKLGANYVNNKWPHVQVVEKMRRREPGSEPAIGMPVIYGMFEPPNGKYKPKGGVSKSKRAPKELRVWHSYELSDDIGYALRHKMPPNARWYFECQYRNGFSTIMAFIWYPDLIPEGDPRGDKYKREFTRLQKKINLELFKDLKLYKRSYTSPESLEAEKSVSIRRFTVALRQCLCCSFTLDSSYPGDLCPQCMPHIKKLTIVAIEEAAAVRYDQLAAYQRCFTCPASEGKLAKAVQCANMSCDNFIRKIVLAQNLPTATDKSQRLQRELDRQLQQAQPPEQELQAPAKKRAHITIAIESSRNQVVAPPLQRRVFKQPKLAF